MRLEPSFRMVLRKQIDVTVERLALKRRRRPRPDAGLPQMAAPPRGPSPLTGGAAAPLDFD